MAHAIDDLKMVHEEEMKNYDRIESAVVSVMRRHGCKIIQTPTFEDYDTYGTYFPQLQREMIKTISSEGEVLVMRPDVTVPLAKTASREYPDARQLLKFGYVCRWSSANTMASRRTGSISFRAGSRSWGMRRRSVMARSW